MVVAAAAAALLAMVSRISAGNPKFAGQREAAERIAARADGLRARFLAGRAEDEAAFDAVTRAQKLPKDDARAAALEGALDHAARVPLELAGCVVETLELAIETLAIENRNLISDVGCAAAFAQAAFEACAYNVRINHKYMKQPAAVAGQSAELESLSARAATLSQTVRERVMLALP